MNGLRCAFTWMSVGICQTLFVLKRRNSANTSEPQSQTQEPHFQPLIFELAPDIFPTSIGQPTQMGMSGRRVQYELSALNPLVAACLPTLSTNP